MKRKCISGPPAPPDRRWAPLEKYPGTAPGYVKCTRTYHQLWVPSQIVQAVIYRKCKFVSQYKIPHPNVAWVGELNYWSWNYTNIRFRVCSHYLHMMGVQICLQLWMFRYFLQLWILYLNIDLIHFNSSITLCFKW